MNVGQVSNLPGLCDRVIDNDPCRLVRQVKEIAVLPDKPAGAAANRVCCGRRPRWNRYVA